jgi:hypothetical protein
MAGSHSGPELGRRSRSSRLGGAPPPCRSRRRPRFASRAGPGSPPFRSSRRPGARALRGTMRDGSPLLGPSARRQAGFTRSGEIKVRIRVLISPEVRASAVRISWAAHAQRSRRRRWALSCPHQRRNDRSHRPREDHAHRHAQAPHGCPSDALRRGGGAPRPAKPVRRRGALPPRTSSSRRIRSRWRYFLRLHCRHRLVAACRRRALESRTGC